MLSLDDRFLRPTSVGLFLVGGYLFITGILFYVNYLLDPPKGAAIHGLAGAILLAYFCVSSILIGGGVYGAYRPRSSFPPALFVAVVLFLGTEAVGLFEMRWVKSLMYELLGLSAVNWYNARVSETRLILSMVAGAVTWIIRYTSFKIELRD